MDRIQVILNFFFGEFESETDFERAKVWRLFSATDEFNAEIREKFENDVNKAVNGDYDNWRSTPNGCLALLVLLDQFTRNLDPNTADQLRGDSKALIVAKQAIDNEFDKQVWPIHRMFFYLPFEHSEDVEHQNYALYLLDSAILDAENETKILFENFRSFAVIHKILIEKYGRFPGRNKYLGRENTEAEEEYLKNNPDAL